MLICQGATETLEESELHDWLLLQPRKINTSETVICKFLIDYLDLVIFEPPIHGSHDFLSMSHLSTARDGNGAFAHQVIDSNLYCIMYAHLSGIALIKQCADLSQGIAVALAT